METDISDEQLRQLSDCVAEKMGLYFPSSKWPELKRGVLAAIDALGFEEDTAACVQWLTSASATKHQLEALACHLTVGETYFFRENRHFSVLTDHILPAIVQQRHNGERRLRIWSTACCTGEEPYSIAILLRRVIPDWERWNITLLATDINARFLRKAAAGVFGQWSFRDTPAWLKEQYFSVTADGQFEIHSEIRRMVRFAQLNLAEDTYPSLPNDTNAMDIIFCRNVLMYFTAPQARKVIEKLHRAQVDGGWLIVGSTELPHVSSSPYLTTNLEGAILYRKEVLKPQPIDCHPWEKCIAPTLADQPLNGSYSGSASQTLAVESTLLITGLKNMASPEIEDETCLDTDAAALYEQGRYAEAAGQLMKLFPDRSNQSDVYSLLVHSLANQGKLSEALIYCDQWIAADKLSPSAHYLRAIVLQEQGKTDEAIPSLRKAVYVDPGFILAHFTLGNISRLRGQESEATRHFDHALYALRGCQPDDILPDSGGMTAGRLTNIVRTLMIAENGA